MFIETPEQIVLILLYLFFMLMSWRGETSFSTTWIYRLRRPSLVPYLAERHLSLEGNVDVLRHRLSQHIKMFGFPVSAPPPTTLADAVPISTAAGSSNITTSDLVSTAAPGDVPVSTITSHTTMTQTQVTASISAPCMASAVLPQSPPQLQQSVRNIVPLAIDSGTRSICQTFIEKVTMCQSARPHDVFKFVIEVQRIVTLGLIPESLIMTYLLPKTQAPLTDILVGSIQTNAPWSECVSRIRQLFFSERARLDLFNAYVLQRFQTPTESFDSYLQTIIWSSNILAPEFAEDELVDIVLDNLLPECQSVIYGRTRPSSIEELYGLSELMIARQVREEQRTVALATKDSRIPSSNLTPTPGISSYQSTPPPRLPSQRKPPVCWDCNEVGHVRTVCPRRPAFTPRPSGNFHHGPR